MLNGNKSKVAVWIVERIGLPTALVGVGLWMITTFWLGPELETKAESRRVLAALIEAQQTAIGIQGESLKGQIRLLEVNTKQTEATKEALLVLTAIVISFGMSAVIVMMALGAFLETGHDRIDTHDGRTEDGGAGD